MSKDEIQFWMLIAFAVASVLGFYKVYFLFNTPVEGLDTKAQHEQLEEIITDFLQELDALEHTASSLFERINELEQLQEEEYKNFNQNRFNQLLQQLFHKYEVHTLDELIVAIQNER